MNALRVKSGRLSVVKMVTVTLPDSRQIHALLDWVTAALLQTTTSRGRSHQAFSDRLVTMSWVRLMSTTIPFVTRTRSKDQSMTQAMVLSLWVDVHRAAAEKPTSSSLASPSEARMRQALVDELSLALEPEMPKNSAKPSERTSSRMTKVSCMRAARLTLVCSAEPIITW